ncbi:hypothetical protein HUN39_09335 [Methylocystis sp. FS]|uniref:hypothetical protein n=1 Tax=Methylocystis silviterrae TaxID=2743612 RepID=UPI00158303DD|nr:hypothetical protein [Methylocystis silviterrae]NUJ80230.1 hypothetical protein [Methylocystis silviterrae]
MNQSLWRRGGLVDFASLEFHSKAVLIFVFLLFQFVALPPIGMIIVFVVVSCLVFPFFGLIPPSFMEEAPPVAGWTVIALVALTAFIVSSLPIALYFKIPGRLILLLAIIGISGVLLIFYGDYTLEAST